MNCQTTLKNEEDKKNPKFHGYVIEVAYNPISKRYEQVFAEDEVPTNKRITMYWSDDKYITIPED